MKSERLWSERHILFNRVKTASSKHRAKKREAIKARWYLWCDKFTWVK